MAVDTLLPAIRSWNVLERTMKVFHNQILRTVRNERPAFSSSPLQIFSDQAYKWLLVNNLIIDCELLRANYTCASRNFISLSEFIITASYFNAFVMFCHMQWFVLTDDGRFPSTKVVIKGWYWFCRTSNNNWLLLHHSFVHLLTKRQSWRNWVSHSSRQCHSFKVLQIVGFDRLKKDKPRLSGILVPGKLPWFSFEEAEYRIIVSICHLRVWPDLWPADWSFQIMLLKGTHTLYWYHYLYEYK